jgi:hypothetical protein
VPILFRDIETRSTLNLADAGAWRYAADQSTEVFCVGFAVDNGPVQIRRISQFPKNLSLRHAIPIGSSSRTTTHLKALSRNGF